MLAASTRFTRPRRSVSFEVPGRARKTAARASIAVELSTREQQPSRSLFP